MLVDSNSGTNFRFFDCFLVNFCCWWVDLYDQMMKKSVEETSESIRRHDVCDRFKDKSPSLPSRPTSKAQISSIRQTISAKFCNAIDDQSGGVITTSETKEKDDKVCVEKNSEEHCETECLNNVDHFIKNVIDSFFIHFDLVTVHYCLLFNYLFDWQSCFISETSCLVPSC